MEKQQQKVIKKKNGLRYKMVLVVFFFSFFQGTIIIGTDLSYTSKLASETKKKNTKLYFKPSRFQPAQAHFSNKIKNL